MECRDDGVSIQVRNVGVLPPGFSLDQFPGGVSGLGLVRALLPRRSAQLTLSQEGLTVLTTIRLSPPGITRQMPGSRQEPAGQQITLCVARCVQVNKKLIIEYFSYAFYFF